MVGHLDTTKKTARYQKRMHPFKSALTAAALASYRIKKPEVPKIGEKIVKTRGNSYICLFSGRPRFGSVRLRFGDGTVRAVPVFGSGGSSKEGVFVFSVQFRREDSSSSGFGSWRTVPAVPVPRSVPGPAKTVPMVLVSGSSSVPGPPCIFSFFTSLAKFSPIFGGYFCSVAGRRGRNAWIFAS